MNRVAGRAITADGDVLGAAALIPDDGIAAVAFEEPDIAVGIRRFDETKRGALFPVLDRVPNTALVGQAALDHEMHGAGWPTIAGDGCCRGVTDIACIGFGLGFCAFRIWREVLREHFTW